jgi:hypothetical protein
MLLKETDDQITLKYRIFNIFIIKIYIEAAYVFVVNQTER